MSIRIFVYGSLKPDEYNYSVCADRVVAVEPAIAYGTLYDLPFGYPAMTIGTDQIQGYLLTFHDPEILPFLDDFETHDLPTQNCDYDRHSIEVFSDDGSSLETAWVYRMTPEQVQQVQGQRLTTDSWHSQK
jgi:gamma-glutamylcyclotransferase (GGCT)/AIG2-like uncharacterized protein YtfP